MERTFGELAKSEVFIRNKRWYKKISEKNSGMTIQSSGIGSALDEKGRINIFGNDQKVNKYEFRRICE